MLIYNSLSKSKEEFQPIEGKTVKIYACGPTPYDYSHLGHARVYIIWDFIQRYLRFKGYDVIYARNITDVEDKIINKAKALGVSPEAVARKFTYEFWHDMDALNVQPPDSEPRATEYILQMIAFIEGLIANGHAYVADSDVYFDVASLGNEYGQLSKQDFSERLIGARDQVTAQTELEKRKKNPYDFALWKGFDPKEDEGNYPRIGSDIKWQYCWESPWGRGRPGWHIECSTMVKHVLGETIDLHGGGEDLLFPHHENELAQSTGFQHKPLARFWVHNGFIQVNSEKMSKSLGNFNTIRDVMKQYSADEIRLFILQTHYRNPIDFAPESLDACKTAIQRLIRAVEFLPEIKAQKDEDNFDITASNDSKEIFARHKEQIDLPTDELKEFDKGFCAAMDNDFNTAVAVALLFNLAESISKKTDQAQKEHAARVLLYYANLLGFRLIDNRQKIQPQTSKKLMDLLLELRATAKDKKDYAAADLIRSTLTANGINIMDSKEGSTWEVVSQLASNSIQPLAKK